MISYYLQDSLVGSSFVVGVDYLWKVQLVQVFVLKTKFWLKYRRADKSLARPGRKQATATDDFYFHITYL